MIEMVAGEADVGENVSANKNVHFLCIIEVKSGKFLSNYSSPCVKKVSKLGCVLLLS
jgi:hypothetical protein